MDSVEAKIAMQMVRMGKCAGAGDVTPECDLVVVANLQRSVAHKILEKSQLVLFSKVYQLTGSAV